MMGGKTAIEEYINPLDGNETNKVKVMELEVAVASGNCKVTCQNTDQIPFEDPSNRTVFKEDGETANDLMANMIGIVDLGLLRYDKEKSTDYLRYELYKVN